MKVITITLNHDGTLDAEGHGFVGKECEAKMKPLLDALGGEVLEGHKKPEYEQVAQQGRRQAQ